MRQQTILVIVQLLFNESRMFTLNADWSKQRSIFCSRSTFFKESLFVLDTFLVITKKFLAMTKKS